MVETVERLLCTPSQMGLHTRVQCLEYLGSLFRGTLDVPERFTDLQVRGLCCSIPRISVLVFGMSVTGVWLHQACD